MTIHCKAVEQYFTVVLFVFQYYPVCNFGKFINLDLALSGMKGLIAASATSSGVHVLVFHKLAFCFHHVSVYWIHFGMVKPFQVVEIDIS